MTTTEGFSIVPSINNDDADDWRQLLDLVEAHFHDDSRVVVAQNGDICFDGKHCLPVHGQNFLGFEATSDHHAEAVLMYAKMIFDDRVQTMGSLEPASVLNGSSRSLVGQAGDSALSIREITPTQKDIFSSSISVCDIKGKGKGVAAVTDIPISTRVLSEKPLMVAQCLPDKDAMNRLVLIKLKRTPLEQQRGFLSLHHSSPGNKHIFANIFNINALPCGPSLRDGAVYPNVCRLNHSCQPNCIASWHPTLQQETVHAIRHIKKGEELTLQYYNEPTAARREYLYRHFGFWCACPLCQQPPAAKALSDARRAWIERLRQDTCSADRARTDPDGCLLDCRAVVRLSRAEYAGAVMGTEAAALWAACQVCQAHGDHARARAFAARARRARAVSEGDDSPVAERMGRAAEDPCAELGVADGPGAWANPASLAPPEGYPQRLHTVWLWRQGTEGADFDVDEYLQGRICTAG